MKLLIKIFFQSSSYFPYSATIMFLLLKHNVKFFKGIKHTVFVADD